MKTISLILVVLVLAAATAHAKVYDSHGQQKKLCVDGTGDFSFRGTGDVYIDGVGSFDVPKGVELEQSGFFPIDKGSHVTYIGDGWVNIEDFSGEIRMRGGGLGYLEVDGIGVLKLKKQVGSPNNAVFDCR